MRLKYILFAWVIIAGCIGTATHASSPSPRLPGRNADIDDQIIIIRVMEHGARNPIKNAKVSCARNRKRHSDRTNANGIAVIVLPEDMLARVRQIEFQCSASQFGRSSANANVIVMRTRRITTLSIYL